MHESVHQSVSAALPETTGRHDLPGIHDQADNLGVFKVDFADNPVEDGLAAPVGRHGVWAEVHTSDASHGASDTDELGTLGLLQQRKDGLEEEQGCEAIDDDVLLEHLGVDGGDGFPVVADAGVGDDEIKLIDALRLDGFDGCGGVGLALVVDLDDDDLAGGIFGDGRELLGGGVVGITDTSNDDGVRAREVDVNKAGTNACVWLVSGKASRPRGMIELASVGTGDEDVGGRHLLVGLFSVELEGIEEGREAFHVR